LVGFYKTFNKFGIKVRDYYIKKARYHDPNTRGLATRELLELKDPPTCIMYTDDFSFIGGMNEIEKHGLIVPDDISVVGYDGIYLSQVLRPRLTTFKQDTEALGKEAVKNLIHAIDNKKTYVPKQIWI